MKNILISLPVLLLLLGLGSCEQQFPVESPEIINFEYDAETAYPGANTYFNVEVIGDFSVIWTGAEDSDYDAHLANPTLGNAGFFFTPLLDKLTGTYSIRKGLKYNQTGTYKAVLVVSNVGYRGEVIEQVTQEITVTVVPYTQTAFAVFTISQAIADGVISGDTVSLVVPYGTDVTALKPKFSISDSASVSPASGVAVDFTNPVIYTITAHDGITTQDWTVIVTIQDPSTETEITEFTIPEGRGDAVISSANHTIAVNVPFGTDVTALVPGISISENASVDPASGAAADFTNPVVYTVTAEDGTTEQDWTVTVTKLLASTAADITGFSIPGAAGAAIIDKTHHTVAIAMPNGSNVTALVPEITLSDYATVNPDSGVAADFSSPVVYTVIAEDIVSTQDWTVTVTVLD